MRIPFACSPHVFMACTLLELASVEVEPVWCYHKQFPAALRTSPPLNPASRPTCASAGLRAACAFAGSAVLAMKASGSKSHGECLQKHAARYHRKTPSQKAVVIRNYSKLRGFDAAAVNKHAAQVAAWVACAPHGYIPYRNELMLLKRFIERLSAGLPPTRLDLMRKPSYSPSQPSRLAMLGVTRRACCSRVFNSFDDAASHRTTWPKGAAKATMRKWSQT